MKVIRIIINVQEKGFHAQSPDAPNCNYGFLHCDHFLKIDSLIRASFNRNIFFNVYIIVLQHSIEYLIANNSWCIVKNNDEMYA